MIGFAAPLWLLLLPVALLPVWLARRGGAGSIRHARVDVLGGATRRGARWIGAAPEWLRALTLLLLVLALSRPGRVQALPQHDAEAAPVVVALDVSSSMLARDLGPETRLEVARRVLADFLRMRGAQPLGLVAFAGEAVTLVPVTTHQPVLQSALRTLRVGIVEDGTAIGEGLAVALNRLRTLPAGDKAVVLLSDGRNNRGGVDPREAAEAARLLGIRVYTIGIGSLQAAAAEPPAAGRPARAPVEDAAEAEAGLDEALLRDLAQRTGGRFFRADDAAALRQAYAEIDRLEGTPPPPPQRGVRRPWTGTLLLLAALFLLAERALLASRWGRVP